MLCTMDRYYSDKYLLIKQRRKMSSKIVRNVYSKKIIRNISYII